MIFWTLFSIFAVCLILESITSWIFIRGSKKKHPDLWRHAGKPTLLGNGDLFSAWPLNQYLIHRQYQQLGNKGAVQFAEKIRLPFIITYFMALISVLVFIAFFFINGASD